MISSLVILAGIASFAAAQETCETKSFPLIAGQHNTVGTVTIRNSKRFLYVTYDVDEEYGLYTTHLNVNSAGDGAFVSKVNGKSFALDGSDNRPPPGKHGTVPGQSLQMSWDATPVQSYTYQVKLTDVDSAQGASMLVLSHAGVINRLTGDSDTAYGGDACVNIGSGGAWFCSASYDLCDVETPYEWYDICADNDCGPASIGACAETEPISDEYVCNCAQGYGDNVNYDPDAPNEAGQVRCQNLDFCNTGFDTFVVAPSGGDRRLLAFGAIGDCGDYGECVDCPPPSLYHSCMCPEGFFDNYGTCEQIDMCTEATYPLLNLGEALPLGDPWFGALYPNDYPTIVVADGATCSNSKDAAATCVDYDPTNEADTDKWGKGWSCDCSTGYVDEEGVCEDENTCKTRGGNAACGGDDWEGAGSKGQCLDRLAPSETWDCDCADGFFALDGPTGPTCVSFEEAINENAKFRARTVRELSDTLEELTEEGTPCVSGLRVTYQGTATNRPYFTAEVDLDYDKSEPFSRDFGLPKADWQKSDAVFSYCLDMNKRIGGGNYCARLVNPYVDASDTAYWSMFPTVHHPGNLTAATYVLNRYELGASVDNCPNAPDNYGVTKSDLQRVYWDLIRTGNAKADGTPTYNSGAFSTGKSNTEAAKCMMLDALQNKDFIPNCNQHVGVIAYPISCSNLDNVCTRREEAISQIQFLRVPLGGCDWLLDSGVSAVPSVLVASAMAALSLLW